MIFETNTRRIPLTNNGFGLDWRFGPTNFGANIIAEFFGPVRSMRTKKWTAQGVQQQWCTQRRYENRLPERLEKKAIWRELTSVFPHPSPYRRRPSPGLLHTHFRSLRSTSGRTQPEFLPVTRTIIPVSTTIFSIKNLPTYQPPPPLLPPGSGC